MTWKASASKALAQTLHVAALTGQVGPGYAKRDAQLRRAAGVPEAELADISGGLVAALETSVTSGESPWAHIDARWFDTRWSMGEADAVGTQTKTLVERIDVSGLERLIPGETQLQATSAVGGRPLALAQPPLVLAAPDAPRGAVIVALIGAQISSALPPDALEVEDRRWMCEWIACTLIRRVVGETPFLDWLKPLVKHLVGEFESASKVEERVRRIARAVLDQPPGEIERIGVGLGRRLQSRVDRAIRRGFFTPPSFDPDAWLDARVSTP